MLPIDSYNLSSLAGIILSAPNAYLDPGSGSFILQLVLAAVLGGLFIIKGYWMKIKGLFTKKDSDPEIQKDQQGEP
jgi:ribose/xylose/arabinose/galactoside ABC-type transport system permease subunit